MSSDASADQHSSAQDHLRRAALLADLGCYADAVEELGFALVLEPDDVPALTMLARVRLAAGQPVEARTVAETALAVSAANPALLTLRAFALIDLRRFGEAARVGDELLALGATDAYAQRSGAAILAEARNGQAALDAAWRGVELAPEESQAHLVLGLVAGRLGLFELAERAYREALRLDPELGEARRDPGVARLERRRYAEALELLAEESATEVPWTDPARVTLAGVRRMVLYGAGYGIVAAVLAAFLAAGDEAMSRVWAVVAALLGLILVRRLTTGLPGFARRLLPELWRVDRPLALAVHAVLAALCLLVLYAGIGTPWPLVLAVTATGVAELAVLRGPR